MLHCYEWLNTSSNYYLEALIVYFEIINLLFRLSFVSPICIKFCCIVSTYVYLSRSIYFQLLLLYCAACFPADFTQVNGIRIYSNYKSFDLVRFEPTTFMIMSNRRRCGFKILKRIFAVFSKTSPVGMCIFKYCMFLLHSYIMQ